MANQFGYNQQFTDKPEMWSIDGYAVVSDGYGTLVFQINQLQTTGVLKLVQQNSPTSAVHDITQSANNSGIYKIHLNQTWNQLVSAHIETVIPTGQSPAVLLCQQLTDTVGNTSFGPGQTELQYLQFTTVVPSTGSAGSLAQGCGLRFQLRLKNSSA